MITDQERRTLLQFGSIILSVISIAAWAMYVDPDEGYNRFERYGWQSWHVWGPLLVTLAVVAALLFALWLILRRLP